MRIFEIDSSNNDEPVRIKLRGFPTSPDDRPELSPAKKWIKKVYAAFPQPWNNYHIMDMGGEGANQQLVFFELEPSSTKRGAVEVKWFQAYPQRQGVGSRAMRMLQDMAREDGITLTLYPWKHGRVSQGNLKKFYKKAGYKPIDKGADAMIWSPTTEAFNKPYKSKWGNSDYDDIDVLAKLPDGTPLSIMFNREGDDEWQVEFHRDHSTGVTGQGDAQRIFATVITAIQKFIKKRNPEVVRFSASKEVEPGQSSQSRAKLYDRLVQRYAHEWGYDAYQEDHGDQVTYELTRVEGVTESQEQKISVKDILAYLKKVMGTESHEDWRNNVIDNNEYFVLKDIPLNSLWIDLPMLDKANVEKYKKMDFSKAPPIVIGSDGNIIDGYHRANVAKALGIKSIKAYVGAKGVTENFADGKGPGKPGDSVISGKEMLNIFKKMHHEHGYNKQMEQWIAKQTWSLDTIEPEQLQDMYNDDEDSDPFERTVWLDDAAVTKYERILKAGQLVNPIIMGPNRTVIDGNHRAQAAKNLNVSIPGYVPTVR